MQPLSFTIVDYSSENTKYPVTNIQHAQGRWETAGEETEAFVELQFSAPQRIGKIHLGESIKNNG